MDSPLLYLPLADAVLAMHATLVVFIVGGLVLIMIGNWRAWPWVNAAWFRLLHLAAIAFVVVEAWVGSVCPLTDLEMELRARAGATTYEGDFIAHWLARLLYYEAPAWVFTLVYSLFGLAVLAAWYFWPPRFRLPRQARR